MHSLVKTNRNDIDRFHIIQPKIISKIYLLIKGKKKRCFYDEKKKESVLKEGIYCILKEVINAYSSSFLLFSRESNKKMKEDEEEKNNKESMECCNK